MMVLSAHFALLACLCAALPLALPPLVEAAHLSGHHRSPSDPAHSHDGKHHGHKAPDHRAQELPPLLRRHDHKRVSDGQGPHTPNHPQVLGSAFARSRPRRDPAFLSRRSSIYVSGEHGSKYLVSKTPPRAWGNLRGGADRQPPPSYRRRQASESNLPQGRIDILAAQPNGSTQRLASLTVDSTPVDWTSGQSSSKAFQLNASTTNQTQFIMLPMEDASRSAGSFVKHVTIATEVFDASNADMVMFCATYDPDPGSSSVLVMTPCTAAAQTVVPVDDQGDPCSGTVNDASDPHYSQIFSYDPSSGKIEPISTTINAGPPGCAGARIKRDGGNSTTTGSTRPSSTSTSSAPTTTTSQQAQNVTLVYVAGPLEVPASSPSVSTGQAPVLTTTITTTIVSTVTGSASVRTVSPAQAAVSVSTSPTPSQSTTAASIPSVPVSVPRSSPAVSLPSSALASATSKAPANLAEESLEVEVVGVPPSGSPSPSPTSSTTTSSATVTTTTSSHSSASRSLDPAAVASLLANTMAHPRR